MEDNSKGPIVRDKLARRMMRRVGMDVFRKREVDVKVGRDVARQTVDRPTVRGQLMLFWEAREKEAAEDRGTRRQRGGKWGKVAKKAAGGAS